ncbi:MAG TPA: MHYT domain-containing protein [Candidatus Angelobacter sp.]|nr:MHYT domain-containing protein [Candidatus Angelobacter sp.]
MDQSTIIQTSYNSGLIALSVLIAAFASWAALDLSARVFSSEKSSQAGWLLGGAVAMGTGIWSMHYTGMLAFRLPIPVFYHVPTVLLSLLYAIGASFVALYTVSRQKFGVLHVGAGSLLMAGGIAGMHYTGMAAMRMSAMHHWDQQLVIASVVVAWLVSLAGLGLMKVNLVIGAKGRSGSESMMKIVFAITMGFAIPAMHYMGMAAVHYVAMKEAPDLSYSVEITGLGSAAIIIASVIVMGSIFFVHRLASPLQSSPLVRAEGQRH